MDEKVERIIDALIDDSVLQEILKETGRWFWWLSANERGLDAPPS